MRNLLYLAYQHVFIFAFMLILLFLANLIFNPEYIPIIQFLIVACLYTIYSFVISLLCLCFWQGADKLKIGSAILYILISLTVIPCIDSLIYAILPLVNIRFSRHMQSADQQKFYFNIISGYLVANLLASGAFLRFRGMLLRKEKNQLNEDLEKFRERALGMQYTSHFLTTIFLTNFGKMLIDEQPANKRTKRDIIQFLAYLLEVEKNGELKPFDEELDQLNCFVRLLQDYFGDRAIRYQLLIKGTEYPTIPTGILFFPLENCLKHALIGAEYPIICMLTGNERQVVLNCTNHWAPKTDEIRSETGFGLLQAKLAQVDYLTTLETVQQDGTFSVDIKLNFFEKK